MTDAPRPSSSNADQAGPARTADPVPAAPAAAVQVIRTPSGTTLDVRSDAEGDRITVRAASGSIDLSIRMTDQGPVLSLKGIRLEIEAADAIAVHCREFAVTTTESLRLHSGADLAIGSDAEIRMQSRAATFVDADVVNLNCLDRTGYHDHGSEDGSNAAGGKDTEGPDRPDEIA